MRDVVLYALRRCRSTLIIVLAILAWALTAPFYVLGWLCDVSIEGLDRIGDYFADLNAREWEQ